MYQFIKTLATTNSCNGMKSEMISKNETSLKRQTIRRNFKLTMLIFLMISSFIFVSCQEDPKSNPTTIQFQNISEYPFKVWMDGEYKTTVSGGSSSDQYVVTAGSKQIKIEQESGYFYYPLKADESFPCIEGQYNICKFPLHTNGQITVKSNANYDPETGMFINANVYAIYIDGAIKTSSLNPNVSQTFDVDGWRQHTVTWWLNGTLAGGTTVQVDAGYIYTVQISN